MITDKVGGSSAKPEVSKQSKEKRLKHKVSGDQSPGATFYWEPCQIALKLPVLIKIK